MARPRKSSEELKASGAKPFKVAKRVAEEQAALGILAVEKEKFEAVHGPSIPTFIARVKKERETFFERLDPKQTVCKEYGADFNWRIRPMSRMAERVGL